MESYTIQNYRRDNFKGNLLIFLSILLFFVSNIQMTENLIYLSIMKINDIILIVIDVLTWISNTLIGLY